MSPAASSSTGASSPSSGSGSTGFGAACLAFLWPQLGVGFGSEITIGSTADVDTKIKEGQGFAYYPEGRLWVTALPGRRAGRRQDRVLAPGARQHGGGRTPRSTRSACTWAAACPSATTSQWFECQCHGSQYNRNGEKKGGPAPRGLDRFPLTVDNGKVNVNTGIIIQGPPIGTNTTGQEAEGPHCVGGGEH